MSTFKKTLQTNWHAMRLVRLAMGGLIAVQAIEMQSILIGFFSLFFLFQALTDTGCGSSGNCTLIPGKKNRQPPENL